MVRNGMQMVCQYCGKRGPYCYSQCAVTPNMRTAIKEYAKAHGRRWKFKLGIAWMQDSSLSQELQAARNIMGPTRLQRLKLK